MKLKVCIVNINIIKPVYEQLMGYRGEGSKVAIEPGRIVLRCQIINPISQFRTNLDDTLEYTFGIYDTPQEKDALLKIIPQEFEIELPCKS